MSPTGLPFTWGVDFAARRGDTIYCAILTLCSALLLLAIAGAAQIGAAPTTAFAFCGAFVIHMIEKGASRREVVAAVVSGAAFGTIYVWRHNPTSDFAGSTIGIPGAFLGMGSLFVLVSRWIWTRTPEKPVQFDRLRDAALVPLLRVVSVVAIAAVADVTPITWDSVLYAFDTKFGGAPSWTVGRWFEVVPLLRKLCAQVYNSLPVVLAAGIALQNRDRNKGSVVLADFRWLVVSLGAIGFLLYQLCPAAGPAFLFVKQFPNQIPHLSAMDIRPAPLAPFARNGMPSLHAGWVLLLYWNFARRGPWFRIGTILYLLLTVLATLGLGEHYLIDLVVAPAVALAIQAACTRTKSPSRWAAIAAGSGLTLAWLIAFRTGVASLAPPGLITWTLGAVTVLVPLIIEMQLPRFPHGKRAISDRSPN